MTFLRRLTLISAASLLAACGGSGSSSPVTTAEANDAFDELFQLFEAELTFQTEAELIAKGSASYSGNVFAGVTTTDDVFFGRARLEVDFTDGGSVTGVADDFVTFVDPLIGESPTFAGLSSDVEFTELNGELTLSGGALTSEPSGDATAGVLEIDVSGNIVIPATISITDAREDYTIDGILAGLVIDDERFVAEGGVTATSPGASFESFVYILAD